MATGTSIATRVSARVHDIAQAELSAANYLAFVNDAIDDLVNAGWLERLGEDTSLSMTTNTWDYNIPASVAWIQMIVQENVNVAGIYDWRIPDHYWWPGLVGATPTLHFDSNLFSPIQGKKLKIWGQKRPAQDIAGGATITAGMEAFIRERATHYAAGYLAAGVSELAQWRKELSEIAYRNSEKMLAHHPQEFRVKPGSRLVPTR